MSEQARVVEHLRQPGSYPSPVGAVEVRQTHISWVFLAGDYAYKLKKDVSLGFLDYSTVELRRRYCEAELRLNRRLAPRVYLDVLPLVEQDGGIRWGSGGEAPERIVDWVVRMRRIPAGAMLDALVREGKVTSAHLDGLLRLLVDFYAHAPRAEPHAPYGTPAAIRRTLEDNFEATRRFVPELIPAARWRAIRSAQLTHLTLEDAAFRARREQGFVRDGHGDLRAEHVGFVPEPIVMDCVEFQDRLRVIDVAQDIAFLRMDLESLGAGKLGAEIVARFVRDTGDHELPSFLPFYVSYRAYVRGKVDLLKRADPHLEAAEREPLRQRALRFLELSHAHALALGKPLLVVVGGLSGTGKSTLAARLAAELGGTHLRSDVIRKRLADVSLGTPAAEAVPGLYSSGHTERTYAALVEEGRAALVEGTTAILDATFSRETQRAAALRLGQEAGARVICLECRAPAELAAERMRRRQEAARDPSDATPAIQAAQRAGYEPWEPGAASPLDGAGGVESVVVQALDALRRAAGARSRA